MVDVKFSQQHLNQLCVGMLLGVWGNIVCSCCCGIPPTDGRVLVVVGVGCVLCENCIVDASILFFVYFVLFVECLQFVVVRVCEAAVVLFCVTGVWWMPWHAGPMKDV